MTIPDYQGIGVAKAMMIFIGEYYAKQRKLPLTMVTSNPQFIHSKIPGWIITRIGHESKHAGSKYYKEIKYLSKTGSGNRITISMKYIPKRK